MNRQICKTDFLRLQPSQRTGLMFVLILRFLIPDWQISDQVILHSQFSLVQPFYGGTYFPPEDNYGRPGFKTLLRSIAAQWDAKNADFREAGDHFTKAIADAAMAEERRSGALILR